MLTPNSFRVPDKFHRMAVNENTDSTDCTAPNNSTLLVPLDGTLGVAPTPAVNTSMSC